ncbi:YkoF family thiamine/hydroxymethylpyrimidine-binding protein [Aeromicrobium sp. UC242_57]|uniref:YkoF family thiamine/hydroxymethylpyrimidine-binding protein n=1 Tax=Aeromicrobium sp. UC242_57 TaxID=3374624 RepID=UPI00379D8004
MTDSPAGARFTVSVLDSAFIDIILGSLAEADSSQIDVTTGDISTFLSGDLQDVLHYVRDVTAGAARGGVHISVALSLVGDPVGATAPTLEPTGVRGPGALEPACDRRRGSRRRLARSHGTYSGDDPHVTRLDGDLAAVLETVACGWLLTGRDDSWPATHVTIAINSPSAIADDA